MNIIHDLITLGERLGLDLALSFPGKPMHLALRINDDGSILSIDMMERSPIRVPWPAPRTNETKPNVLYDNPTYVFGTPGDDRRTTERVTAMYDAHVRIRDAAPESDAMHAVVRFHDRLQAKGVPAKFATIVDIITGARAKSSLNAQEKKLLGLDLVFYYRNAERPICEDPILHSGISQILCEQFEEDRIDSIYDASPLSVVCVHPKVKPRGAKQSVALISTNAAVTKMYMTVDSKRGDGPDIRYAEPRVHAPLSYRAMRLYTGALRWLIAHRSISVPPSDSNVSTLAVYGWAGSGEMPHRIDAIIDGICSGRGERTPPEWKEWLADAIADPDLCSDRTPYHILFMGVDSRIAVRDYAVLPVAEVMANIRRFIDGFSVPRPGSSSRLGASPALIVTDLLGKNGPIGEVQAFMQSILLGPPYRYPRSLLTEALRRYEEEISSRAKEKTISAIPLATMQAFSPLHDYDNYPRFLVGRLFAVLVRRAYAARDPGDLPSIPRQITLVADNPAANLPQVFAISEVHAAKLERRKRYTYQRDVGELMDMILAAGGFPSRATPEEKLIFHLGYRFETNKRFARSLGHEAIR